MRSNDPSELAFAAVYADCEHEILPVTEGHRACLVYNSSRTGPACGRLGTRFCRYFGADCDRDPAGFATSDPPEKLVCFLNMITASQTCRLKR